MKRRKNSPVNLHPGKPTLQVGIFLSYLFYVNRVKAEVGSCNANCSFGCLPPAILAASCLSGAPLAPIPLIPGSEVAAREMLLPPAPPQTPERMGGLGDDLSLSGGGEGSGRTCWAPSRGVLGLQLAGERGAGEEPTEGRERREAERGCRFPSGGGLFPTRAGPAAFLCQGVLPAP